MKLINIAVSTLAAVTMIFVAEASRFFRASRRELSLENSWDDQDDREYKSAQEKLDVWEQEQPPNPYFSENLQTVVMAATGCDSSDEKWEKLKRIFESPRMSRHRHPTLKCLQKLREAVQKMPRCDEKIVGRTYQEIHIFDAECRNSEHELRNKIEKQKHIEAGLTPNEILVLEKMAKQMEDQRSPEGFVSGADYCNEDFDAVCEVARKAARRAARELIESDPIEEIEEECASSRECYDSYYDALEEHRRREKRYRSYADDFVEEMPHGCKVAEACVKSKTYFTSVMIKVKNVCPAILNPENNDFKYIGLFLDGIAMSDGDDSTQCQALERGMEERLKNFVDKKEEEWKAESRLLKIEKDLMDIKAHLGM